MNPHIQWLLTCSPQDFYRWHSVRDKTEVVQSLAALIQAVQDGSAKVER